MSNKSLILHRGTVKPLNHKWPDLGATGRNRQSSRSHPTVPLKLFPLSLDTRGSLLLNQNLLCSHWSCSHPPWHLAWGSLPTVEGGCPHPSPPEPSHGGGSLSSPSLMEQGREAGVVEAGASDQKLGELGSTLPATHKFHGPGLVTSFPRAIPGKWGLKALEPWGPGQEMGTKALQAKSRRSRITKGWVSLKGCAQYYKIGKEVGSGARPTSF